MKKIIVFSLALFSLPMFSMEPLKPTFCMEQVKVDESAEFLHKNALNLLNRCSQQCASSKNPHCMDICMLKKTSKFEGFMKGKYTERCKDYLNHDQCLRVHFIELSRRARSKE